MLREASTRLDHHQNPKPGLLQTFPRPEDKIFDMSTRTMPIVSALTLAAAGAFWAVEARLPPPFATPSANNRPKVIARPDGAQLRVPAGFNVDVFAEGFEVPRFMTMGPRKELLVSDAARDGSGAVYVLEGKERKKIITGLDRPFGLAFWHEYLYVGEPQSIKRYKYHAGNRAAGA